MSIHEIKEVYDQSVRTVRNLVEDIRFCRNLYLDPVKMCAMKINQCLKDKTNFLMLLNGFKSQDKYMYTHPVNVAFTSYIIGKWMNLSRLELFDLTCCGLIHDIGKAKIKDSILNKPGKLTSEEQEIIKEHPNMGFNMLVDLKVFTGAVLLGVLSHHERYDGSGYPAGLKKEQIHIIARIIALADLYDAMTASRSYSAKKTPLQVAEEIGSGSFSYLDPVICQTFLKNMVSYYPGSAVRLSNESVGEIIFVNQGALTRPIVRCGEEYIDLAARRDLEIVEML